MKGTSSLPKFTKGLVFAFDVGTGSIGWAVRLGAEFKDVGVLICPEDTAKLDGRRNLRRQRRTLRSKKYRRRWFGRELAGLLGLKLIHLNGEELPVPEAAWTQNQKGGLVPKPGFESLRDPAALRVAAVEGKEIRPEELFAALTHLFRRRGYIRVPWASGESRKAEDSDKEEGQIREAVTAIERELGDRHPCQLLVERKRGAGAGPTAKWGRNIYWPRQRLEREFRAIVEAQSGRFSQLLEKADWLLFGDTREVKGHRVYFKQKEARNPGALGLKWPRFENRGPALDALRPLDELGRPLHVVRKNKRVFAGTQWEMAVMDFRVIDRLTGAIVAPDAKSISRLREMWEGLRRKPRAKKGNKVTLDAPARVEIKLPLLRSWEGEFSAQYKLVDGQQPLTPQTGAGRARYASPTLNMIREQLACGLRFDPPQPVLLRPGETARRALDRYLADISHPLVRHRLVLFSRLLEKLASEHGCPDLIVLEAVRSIALSEKKKRELQKRNKENQDERASIREELSGRRASTSRKAILRFRLWKEAQSTCPFCGDKITQEQLLNGEADIEHLVPRAVVDCNEFYNLTIGHLRCNREIKGDRTPFQAFAHTNRWDQLRGNAEKCFKGRKLEIFLSDRAEELIERSADLQHTAYIARVIRHVALIQLGWTGEDGRDPTTVKGNIPSSSFQVTNGQITSRLRRSWGLNQILHPLPDGKRWDDLTDADKEQLQQKNRGDLRHHALDAMVISCTLPWLAHRTVGAIDPETGEHGWWKLDERTQRSLALNPVFPEEGQMRKVVADKIANVEVRHHVSRSPHQSAYATTIYGKKAPNTYVAREVFTSLTPKNLSSIWPPDFAVYCRTAWAQFEDEAADIAAELKQSKGCVPESFTNRLCFAHFQQWREQVKRGDDADFSWPQTIKIPIRSVKWVGVKDDNAVAPASSNTKGFVARAGRSPFREVQLQVSEDGTTLVPVFIPSWRKDAPIPKAPIDPSGKAVASIRRGQIVEIKHSPGRNTPCGVYRVASTMQKIIQLIPTHLADKKEALKAAGFLENGVNISWDTFIKAVGYELPHSPPAQSASEGAGEAGSASR